MKIVINISEEDYEGLKRKDKFNDMFLNYYEKLIVYGTPLPKGHGDLIDRSTLEPDTEWSEWYDGWVSYSYGQIADADVVIKADGSEEE